MGFVFARCLTFLFRAYFVLITTCPRCLLVFYYYTLFRLFCPLLFFLFKNYSR